MQLARLEISQVHAQIGVDRQPEQLRIRTRTADFHLKTEHVKVEIRNRPGRLELDASRAWAALDLPGHLEKMRQVYHQSSNIVLQEIAHIAQKGDRFARIDHPSNTIANLAAEKFTKFAYEVMPPSELPLVQMRYEAGKPEIRFRGGRVHLDVEVRPPVVSYQPAKFQIYIARKNHIDIRVSTFVDAYL
jgi:hypothetical protein